MDTVQRRLSYIHSTVDQLRLRYVYRKLRDLSLYRSRVLIQVLAAGPLHVLDIERAMYHAGDTSINQSLVSRHISLLLSYQLIMRVYPEAESIKRHYYALRHKEVRRIQAALDRFIRPTEADSRRVPGEKSPGGVHT